MSKPIYSALFVDDPGKLKSEFPPVHPNLFYHHSTIEFNPQDVSNLEVGKKVSLLVTGRITTDRVDALLVKNAKSKNAYPHITLSTANGVKPVESNKAFTEHSNLIQMFDHPIYVDTTEGYYENNRDVK